MPLSSDVFLRAGAVWPPIPLRWWEPRPDSVAADALCGGNWVYVSIQGPDTTRWTLEFSAAGDAPLVPGVYVEAGSIRRLAAPGLRVSGNGRTCGLSLSTGWFIINEAVFRPSLTVERFRATFEQRCGGSEAALSGEISISDVPRVNLQTLCLR
jgi:hypothetical protein